MLGFLINKWVLGGLAGLLMLGFVYWKGYNHGKEVVQKEWNAQKVEDERIAQEWKDKVRVTEQAMQSAIDKVQREKIDAKKIADSRYNSLIDSLRDRPEARETQRVPNDSSDAVGCTGAGLARPDAEFLAGYAADAAKLQAAYDSCKQAYDTVRQDAAE